MKTTKILLLKNWISILFFSGLVLTTSFSTFADEGADYNNYNDNHYGVIRPYPGPDYDDPYHDRYRPDRPYRPERPNRPGPDRSFTVQCDSDNKQPRTCPIGGRAVEVRLVQQYSSRGCIYGSTWGFDRNYIYVNNGCRALFRVFERGFYRDEDPYRPVRPYPFSEPIENLNITSEINN